MQQNMYCKLTGPKLTETVYIDFHWTRFTGSGSEWPS